MKKNLNDFYAINGLPQERGGGEEGKPSGICPQTTPPGKGFWHR